MNQYQELIRKQRRFFHSHATRSLAFRMEMLGKFRDAIQRYEPQLMQALKEDLNKSDFDSYLTEIGVVLEELRFTLKHLPQWVKPEKVKTPLTHIGSAGYIYPEPYGVALIIAPWNYPFNLAVSPLIGALAAGNCAILKPSELTPRTSAVLAQLIGETFDEGHVAVIEGGVETSQALLQEKFDYLFFTGSVPVGRIVMEAAAKHLTPVTLELGGKSPCIVHADAALPITAKRIVWGKYLNAGQTCVAPDYLYVHHSVKDELIELMRQAIKELYGEDPLQNEHFTRIISERHFDRLSSFLQDGQVLIGGRADRERLRIEPTVLGEVSWQDRVMQDEIFGPILPVLDYTELGEVIEAVTARPKPLAAYLFTESAQVQKQVLEQLSFGGGCINDTVYHLASPYLPFGGVGESGIGAYHGKGSFDAFSHKKSVLKQTTRFDLPFRYPTMKNGLQLIRRFLGRS